MIKCSFCGFEYDPAEHPSCASCPVHQGCTMTCCPNCGVSNINPAESRLAVWLKKILSGGNHHAQPSLSTQRSTD